MEQAARGNFEISNDVKLVDAAETAFLYTREEEDALEEQQPWKTEYDPCQADIRTDRSPHYFQVVKISAVALIKMVIHARSGGQYEIMGVMYGRVRDHAFWITDAAALPVQGTETRVNAGNEAFEYMVQFQESNKVSGKNDVLRGWYHSHPGYGCWLSGIDVNTQLTNQKFNDPYLAVVIDPNRTVSAGKVEIGAFRTYPEGYVPPSGASSEYQTIPLDKIEDFGAYANSYYPLKIEIYKSKTDEKLLDLLWNKYWVATLSQGQILTGRAYTTSQIKDLNAKIYSAGGRMNESSAGLTLKEHGTQGIDNGKGQKKKEDNVEAVPTALAGPTADARKIAHEINNTMTAQIVKDKLFNQSLNAVIPEATVAEAVRGNM